MPLGTGGPNKDWSRKQLAFWIIVTGTIGGVLMTSIYPFNYNPCPAVMESCPSNAVCTCDNILLPMVSLAIGLIISTSILLLMERVAPNLLQ